MTNAFTSYPASRRGAARFRRVAGLGLTVLATAGVLGVASAGAAPSAQASTCHTHRDINVGPVSAGPAYGSCNIAPGTYYVGHPGAWWVAAIPTPSGLTYIAVHNDFNLPGVDIPVPHL